ncbi:hypothetical protein SeMB42_g02636 [Synchytrium endobioticum]|nr:hypothetical protein SeMB42_g02636 [Synchytrium endobioticum]
MDIANAFIYTGDFSSIPAKSTSGLLRDGDTLLIIANPGDAPIPAPSQPVRRASAHHSEKARDDAGPLDDASEPARITKPKQTLPRAAAPAPCHEHDDEDDAVAVPRPGTSRGDPAKPPARPEWTDSADDIPPDADPRHARHGCDDDDDDSDDAAHPPAHRPRAESARPPSSRARPDDAASVVPKRSESARPTPRPHDTDVDIDPPKAGRGRPDGAEHEHKGRAMAKPAARGARKRALLIGINYTGLPIERAGSTSNVRSVQRFLTARLGYSDAPQDMVLLTDDARDRKRIPTFANILAGVRWLVDGAAAGDTLYLHFCGRGSRLPREHGDDDDDGGSMEDTLVPVDYQKAGQITGNDIDAMLVRGLPPRVHLFACIDCCHSGTMLDLPYVYDKHGRPAQHTPDSVGRSSKAHVVCLSACVEDRDAGDASASGDSGALTYALLKILGDASRLPSYEDLVKLVRDVLKRKGYKQVPIISAGHALELHDSLVV